MKRPRTDISSHLRHTEGGQAFILVAVFLAVLGGIIATAVDLGSYMADRRDLQNAADAIALAASQDLPNAADTQSAADTWAANNDIDPSEMTVTIIPQSLPSEPNPKVRVELQRDHGFFFARLVGVTEAEVAVAASAIKTSPGGSDGLMPWSVDEDTKDAATPGDEVVLKYDSRNPQTGNFGPLRIDGNGASVYEDSIKYGTENGLCAQGVADCSYPDESQTEPGNMTGPTRKGTDHRIDNTEAACDEWNEVVVVAADGTHGLTPQCNPFGNGGNPDSLRVVVVPVINSLCNGACNVDIVEFALFYLEAYGDGGCTGNDCEIKGRFISSNTNYGAEAGVFNANTFAHFVRLVE